MITNGVLRLRFAHVFGTIGLIWETSPLSPVHPVPFPGPSHRGMTSKHNVEKVKKMAILGLFYLCSGLVFQEILKNRSDPGRPQALCGDAAYASSDIMLTPLKTPSITCDDDIEYNKRHKQVRIIIEHVFGQLKKRFTCLLYTFRASLGNVQAISSKNFFNLAFLPL